MDFIYGSCVVFLIGWTVCVDVNGLNKQHASFPFVEKFRRVLNEGDGGDYLDLNVTLSDSESPVASYSSEELKKWPGSACARECKYGEAPRVCYFQWSLENWNVYGP